MVLCRLCYLEINGQLFKDIFDEKFDPPIWEMIFELANLTIVENDSYTKFVCFDCFDQLLKYHVFRKTVLENDKKFKHHNQQEQNKISINNCNDNNNKDCPTIKMEIEDEDYDLIDEKIDVKQYQVNIDKDLFESIDDDDDDSRSDIGDKNSIKTVDVQAADEVTDDLFEGRKKSILSRNSNLIPEKSKKTYEKIYMQFIDWTKENNITTFSEDILVAYYDELSNKMKSSSLSTNYSILKCTLNIKHQIDIGKYTKLQALIKRKSEGYKGKQSKIFTPDEINTFITQAPDNTYLMLKVALIFGIMGACRRHELHDLKFTDVKDMKKAILVTIQGVKTRTIRKFTITGSYYDLCRKYMNLRPENCCTPFFFLNYFKGKCTGLHVGIHNFGNMGKQIATYLKLPDAHLYTGHCFRRSSAAISVDTGGDIIIIKRMEVGGVAS